MSTDLEAFGKYAVKHATDLLNDPAKNTTKLLGAVGVLMTYGAQEDLDEAEEAVRRIAGKAMARK